MFTYVLSCLYMYISTWNDNLHVYGTLQQYVATVPNHSCVWHHMFVPVQLGGLEATAQVIVCLCMMQCLACELIEII